MEGRLEEVSGNGRGSGGSAQGGGSWDGSGCGRLGSASVSLSPCELDTVRLCGEVLECWVLGGYVEETESEMRLAGARRRFVEALVELLQRVLPGVGACAFAPLMWWRGISGTGVRTRLSMNILECKHWYWYWYWHWYWYRYWHWHWYWYWSISMYK